MYYQTVRVRLNALDRSSERSLMGISSMGTGE